ALYALALHDALPIWASRGEVPDESYTVELGKAKVVREGEQVTLIGYGAMVPIMEEAATKAEEIGISAEVIDLRTLLPFDLPTLRSEEHTSELQSREK